MLSTSTIRYRHLRFVIGTYDSLSTYHIASLTNLRSKQLPKDFRDEDGKVMYRARYSHIVPKSIAPELRHDENNINHLCFTCHQKWDFGNKKEMRIYDENRNKFPNYLDD